MKHNYVLIGFWALNLINYATSGNPIKKDIEKIQIISPNPIEHDMSMLTSVLKNYTNYQISYKEQEDKN